MSRRDIPVLHQTHQSGIWQILMWPGTLLSAVMWGSVKIRQMLWHHWRDERSSVSHICMSTGSGRAIGGPDYHQRIPASCANMFDLLSFSFFGSGFKFLPSVGFWLCSWNSILSIYFSCAPLVSSCWRSYHWAVISSKWRLTPPPTS